MIHLLSRVIEVSISPEVQEIFGQNIFQLTQPKIDYWIATPEKVTNPANQAISVDDQCKSFKKWLQKDVICTKPTYWVAEPDYCYVPSEQDQKKLCHYGEDFQNRLVYILGYYY